MHLTKKHLKKIIREEIDILAEEQVSPLQRFAHKAQKFVSDVTSANKPKPGDRLGTGKARPKAGVVRPWDSQREGWPTAMARIAQAAKKIDLFQGAQMSEIQLALFIEKELGPEQLVEYFGGAVAQSIEEIAANVGTYEWELDPARGFYVPKIGPDGKFIRKTKRLRGKPLKFMGGNRPQRKTA